MKKLLVIIVTMVMLLSLALPMMASADETVPTEAVVGGGLTPPFICAKFETPDHETDAGTQISPIAGGTRLVKFYVVTGHPTDVSKITRVDVTVKNPDGSEKYQLVAIKDATSPTGWKGTKYLPDGSSTPTDVRQLTSSDKVDMNADCDTLDPEDLLVPAALDSLDSQGRVTYGKDHNNNQFTLSSVKSDIDTGKQIMLEIRGEMDYKQVAGMYTVEAKSTDNAGATGTALSNQFEYLSIVSLAIDFSKVNWGNIKSGEASYVYGNSVMDGPSSTRPTVQNMGNDPAIIKLNYTAMTNADGKKIETFDGKLNGGGWTDCPVGTATTLQNAAGTAPQVLPPCTPTQIDFSIHPPSTTMGGTYTGSVTILIDHAP